jgi:uncharacterized protein (TIRG00374 family)
LVSVLAVAVIASQLDMKLFVEALRGARYAYVLPCLLLLVLGLWARAVRWRGLLGEKLPFWRTFHVMNVAYFANSVLPFRLGEVARVALAVRPPHDGVTTFSALGSIVIERVLDLLAVVVLVLFALALAPVPPALQTAAGVGGVLALVGFVVLVALARNRARAVRVAGALAERYPLLARLNAVSLLDRALEGFALLKDNAPLWHSVLWTALAWACSVAGGYVLLYAIFDTASPVTAMLYIASAAFAIALPAVPGNIGTYEASILLALVAVGYQDMAQMVAFAVLVHAVNVFVHTATGALGIVQEGVTLGQLTASQLSR